MQETEKKSLIITLRLDDKSMAFFNEQRKTYFPPERNFLQAHLTLFHHLPDEPGIINHIKNLKQPTFELQVNGLINLGAGVAYKADSEDLYRLHQHLCKLFLKDLTLQDQQPLRPHITVMNKSTPERARTLKDILNRDFKPFMASAIGLDLWFYLGGPWQHKCFYRFME
jgi:hypothetical protein